jgi:hypothetical protein
MREPILPAAVIAVAFLTCAVGTAQTAQLMIDANASGGVAVRDDAEPLEPCSITQSVDPNTIGAIAVACNDNNGITFENAYLRLFDLDGDHGFVGTYAVESVDWATNSVVGALDITVNVYCLDEGLPFLYAFMELKDSAATPVADEVHTFHNTAVGGSCDSATEDMAVELYAEDCHIAGCNRCLIGFNSLGDTGPSYIVSATCGIDEPTDIQALTFLDIDLVMIVNGDCDSGDPDVPATTGVGAVLLLLILLGSGAYFLRRRAAT